MKLSIPGLSGRKKEADKTAVQHPLHTKEGGSASIAKVRGQLMLAAIVLMFALALYVFQLMSGQIARALDHEINLTTEQVAARVESLMGHYLSSVALLSRDPEVASLLMSGDVNALDAREESLSYLYPAAINLRLFPPGIDEVDMEASPPLSYAALAQMRDAENNSADPIAEVHLIDAPQQHINIVNGVMDPSGGGIVGHVMLSLSDKVLDGILDAQQYINGYLELQQQGAKGRVVIAAMQDAGQYKDGTPAAISPVKGTRWQVAYWPAQSSVSYLARISMKVLIAFLLVAAVILLLILFLFKRILGAVRTDQVSMVTLMRDYSNHQVRREYPYGLTEMQETIDFITRLAAGGGLAPEGDGSTDREQDLARGTGRNKDLPPALGAFSKGSVLVEEQPLNPAQPDSRGQHGVDASMFRAYDIRGVVNQTLTPEAVTLIGRAIGSEALHHGRDTVVVGRDGRLSGPELSGALIKGLRETGCNVKDIGCVPTPVLYFATSYLHTQTGVMVTGSHNPPEYNGLKIMIDGETLSGEAIQLLRARIENGNFSTGSGDLEAINLVPDYIERIRGDVEVARPIKVVVDCGNGVAGGIAPQLLRSIGCDVVELFCEVDGNFPNHHPDPSKPENLKDLIEAIPANKADLGLAFDGDGDRLGVVSADGSIIWPDRVLMLFARDVLDRNPGAQIIYDVKCSRHLDTLIREHGGEPLMWKTGHSFIKAKIRETGALLAGEMSGHIFFKERWYGFDDGIYAAARLLEILGKDERPTTAVFAELPDSINTPEINVPMREGEPVKFIERLLASAHFEGARVSTIDGLRADFEDGWGLVRASNTTPVLVLRFEADNEVVMTRIKEEFKRVMLQVKPDLSLKF